MKNLCKYKYNNLIQLKTLWQTEKLLIKAVSPFFHNVSKSRLLQRCQQVFVCGKGLTPSIIRVQFSPNIEYFLSIGLDWATNTFMWSPVQIMYLCAQTWRQIKFLIGCQTYDLFLSGNRSSRYRAAYFYRRPINLVVFKNSSLIKFVTMIANLDQQTK